MVYKAKERTDGNQRKNYPKMIQLCMVDAYNAGMRKEMSNKAAAKSSTEFISNCYYREQVLAFQSMLIADDNHFLISFVETEISQCIKLMASLGIRDFQKKSKYIVQQHVQASKLVS